VAKGLAQVYDEPCYNGSSAVSILVVRINGKPFKYRDKKFNGIFFEMWKLNMEDLLVDKDQWIIVDPGTAPLGTSTKYWEKLDQKEKRTIRLCLSYSILHNMSGEAMTKDLWNKLGICIGLSPW
jgi:hypothetical protein